MDPGTRVRIPSVTLHRPRSSVRIERRFPKAMVARSNRAEDTKVAHALLVQPGVDASLSRRRSWVQIPYGAPREYRFNWLSLLIPNQATAGSNPAAPATFHGSLAQWESVPFAPGRPEVRPLWDPPGSTVERASAMNTASCRNVCLGCSSVGRASAWHAEGQRFDPAQLHEGRGRSSVGRALALQAGGRRFEPDRFHEVAGVAQW